VAWLRAIPVAWAFALLPLAPLQPIEPAAPPPVAVEETKAFGTLITMAFEFALPLPRLNRRTQLEMCLGQLRPLRRL
jgi:hypothetical protein